MSEDDRRRRQADAEELLRRPVWTDDEEIDRAIVLHDSLETPEARPDPVVQALRKRLAPALTQRAMQAGQAGQAGQASGAGSLLDMTRAQLLASGWLDSADPLERRLNVLHYLGFTSYVGYQAGALGLLDQAIDFLLQLDEAVQEDEDRARALLGTRYDVALVSLAAACYVRYDTLRELLLLKPPPETDQEIRAHLDVAMAASDEVGPDSPQHAEALGILGSCYALLYEDDESHHEPATIDSAIAMLQEALSLAGTGSGPGELASRIGLADKLAGALLIRDTPQDVEAAIGLLTAIEAEAAKLFPFYRVAGGALTMATALLRRWMHTCDPGDRERARAAHADGFAAALDAHLPAAIDCATQWGGWAWSEGWWAEAGEAYGRAVRAMHLAVRRQANREQRDLILLKATNVASMAAFALARSGAAEEALVTLETGRAVLLAEAFDRRSLDYDRLAALAGRRAADRYRLLTAEMTRLEALLLAGNSPDAGRAGADLEALRGERLALTESLGRGVTEALDELQRPPVLAELYDAAGSTPVVYLAATPHGGLALIVRSGTVQCVELPRLTGRAALEQATALEQAVSNGNRVEGDRVCEALWDLAMSRILPVLDGAAHAIVIPGGRLAALPWHAARVPGQSAEYVADRLAISYMPNLRSLPGVRAAAAEMTSALRVLAIGQPMPTEETERLRSADAEIAAVCSHHSDRFEVSRLPGTEATAGAVREAFSQFDVIHFVGHAQAVAEDPLASAMIMAGDEPLTVGSILAAGTRTARFAVLSACETASVEDLLTDELISFPTALLQCGLGGIVGTLWRSYDRTSPIFMDAFYREWQGSRVPPAEALRRAQKYTRERRFASPLFWAQFVYVGP
jgi:CHAT domain-containing protein